MKKESLPDGVQTLVVFSKFSFKKMTKITHIRSWPFPRKKSFLSLSPLEWERETFAVSFFFLFFFSSSSCFHFLCYLIWASGKNGGGEIDKMFSKEIPSMLFFLAASIAVLQPCLLRFSATTFPVGTALPYLYSVIISIATSLNLVRSNNQRCHMSLICL